jgi:Protein of unknown function (DUF4232)
MSRLATPIGAVVAAAVVLAPLGSASPALRPCTGADLRASGRLQGATGSMVGPVAFRNVSSSHCALGGRPRVSIHDRGGRLLATREVPASLEFLGYRPVTALGPGRRAWLSLQWSEWCGAWPRGVYVRTLFLHVSLTTGRSLVGRVESGRPRCDVRTGSKLGVTPFGVPR